jgi:hypothetical protein
VYVTKLVGIQKVSVSIQTVITNRNKKSISKSVSHIKTKVEFTCVSNKTQTMDSKGKVRPRTGHEGPEEE